MKKLVGTLLAVLFYAFEILGWFFMYAVAVFAVTDGAMVGKIGVLFMLIASVLSACGLFHAVLKWGA